MKLQDQLVSLELSKELKECGYKQKGYFWWKKDDADAYIVADNSRYKISKGSLLCIAPTVAELGEALPCATKRGDIRFYNIGKQKHIMMGDVDIIEYSEADARAKMYIYLQKEGLI